MRAELRRAPALHPARVEATRQWIAASLVAAVAFMALVVLVQRTDALVALGVAALLVAGLAMLVRPELATLLTVFLIYINFPAILTKQHGLPHVVAGAFVVLLGFPLLHFLIIRRQALKADRTFALMLLLLGAYLVSSLVALDRGVAFRAVAEYALEGLLLYWLVFNVIRSVRTLRRVIWTVLLAGSLLSGLSLYQTVTKNYGQQFGGLAYRDFALVQDEPSAEGPARRQSWDRARGPLDEPNRFAQILLVLVPLAAFMVRNATARGARVAAAVCGLLIVGGVMATLSRGGFLTLLVLAALMVAARWVQVSRIAAFAVILALAAPSVPFFVDRVAQTGRVLGLVEAETPAGSQRIDSATLIRVTVMLAAGRAFLEHPVLGVGPGQFGRFYSQTYSRTPGAGFTDLPPGDWRAHSLYLEIAAETGLVGLAVFLGIVGLLLHRLWILHRRWAGRDDRMAELAMAFGLSVVSYQVSGVFLHLSYQPYYWFLLALTGVAVHLMASTPLPERTTPPTPAGRS